MSQSYCPVTGKVMHETYSIAQKALKSIQRRPGHKRIGAGIYECEHCNAHHITGSSYRVASMLKTQHRRKA